MGLNRPGSIMGVRKKYIKHRVDRRLRRLNRILLVLITAMLAHVVYDAFVFKTPLYYIGFALGGYLVGGIFRRTALVQFKMETESFEFTTSAVYVLLTFLLLVFRYAFGKSLLENFHVVYTSDALYLFFIGIYYSKWRMVLKKIDEVIYQYADQKLEENKEDSPIS
ncbi:hypothetical protein [Robiginitalea aurantiaca]|nr:hypothetical protein [Robiginitalea aurantiaca]